MLRMHAKQSKLPNKTHNSIELGYRDDKMCNIEKDGLTFEQFRTTIGRDEHDSGFFIKIFKMRGMNKISKLRFKCGCKLS